MEGTTKLLKTRYSMRRVLMPPYCLALHTPTTAAAARARTNCGGEGMSKRWRRRASLVEQRARASAD
jgi:hypothetical protein